MRHYNLYPEFTKPPLREADAEAFNPNQARDPGGKFAPGAGGVRGEKGGKVMTPAAKKAVAAGKARAQGPSPTSPPSVADEPRSGKVTTPAAKKAVARGKAKLKGPKGYGYTIGDQVFYHGRGRP